MSSEVDPQALARSIMTDEQRAALEVASNALNADLTQTAAETATALELDESTAQGFVGAVHARLGALTLRERRELQGHLDGVAGLLGVAVTRGTVGVPGANPEAKSPPGNKQNGEGAPTTDRTKLFLPLSDGGKATPEDEVTGRMTKYQTSVFRRIGLLGRYKHLDEEQAVKALSAVAAEYGKLNLRLTSADVDERKRIWQRRIAGESIEEIASDMEITKGAAQYRLNSIVRTVQASVDTDKLIDVIDAALSEPSPENEALPETAVVTDDGETIIDAEQETQSSLDQEDLALILAKAISDYDETHAIILEKVFDPDRGQLIHDLELDGGERAPVDLLHTVIDDLQTFVQIYLKDETNVVSEVDQAILTGTVGLDEEILTPRQIHERMEENEATFDDFRIRYLRTWQDFVESRRQQSAKVAA